MRALDLVMIGETDESHDNPEFFQVAWNCPNGAEREHLRMCIKKDLNDTIKKKVWRSTRADEIPRYRRLIGLKYVFMKKKNGVILSFPALQIIFQIWIKF